MSRRPKLVEEGIPIVLGLQEQSSSYTNLKHESYEQVSSSSVVPMSFTISNKPGEDQRPQESLQSIANIRNLSEIWEKKKMENTSTKSETYFVIGGNADSSSERQDEGMMDIDHEYFEEQPLPSNYYGSNGYPSRDYENFLPDEEVSRMEGVETGPQLPLVVVDGANIAHSYTEAKASMYQKSSLSSSVVGKQKNNADVEGIKIAVKYFIETGKCRVMVVLPAYWMKPKNMIGSINSMTAQVEALQDLHRAGMLCCAPPADDDDAYIMSIARRSDQLAFKRGGGGGFVLSNDMYRDAITRDNGITNLREWLNENNANQQGPGRISYTFADLGSLNDYGDNLLDFVPNPTHPFIHSIENVNRH